MHGTDTMAYTASALSLMLLGFRKPIVLTGSQRPLVMPRSDARQNLIGESMSNKINSMLELMNPFVKEFNLQSMIKKLAIKSKASFLSMFLDSITCATAPHYAPYVNLQEVAVCFGGYLLRGNRAQKINSSSYRVMPVFQTFSRTFLCGL